MLVVESSPLHGTSESSHSSNSTHSESKDSNDLAYEKRDVAVYDYNGSFGEFSYLDALSLRQSELVSQAPDFPDEDGFSQSAIQQICKKIASYTQMALVYLDSDCVVDPILNLTPSSNDSDHETESLKVSTNSAEASKIIGEKEQTVEVIY